jgi:hypothetical protein
MPWKRSGGSRALAGDGNNVVDCLWSKEKPILVQGLTGSLINHQKIKVQQSHCHA